MANGLVHERVEFIFLCVCGDGNWLVKVLGGQPRRHGGHCGAGGVRRVKICEGNDAVVVLDAVKDIEKGVFPARDEGDDIHLGKISRVGGTVISFPFT